MADQKNTWRRTVEGEIKTMNNTWGQSKDGQGQTEMEDLCCCPTCERHIGQYVNQEVNSCSESYRLKMKLSTLF